MIARLTNILKYDKGLCKYLINFMIFQNFSNFSVCSYVVMQLFHFYYQIFYSNFCLLEYVFLWKSFNEMLEAFPSKNRALLHALFLHLNHFSFYCPFPPKLSNSNYITRYSNKSTPKKNYKNRKIKHYAKLPYTNNTTNSNTMRIVGNDWATMADMYHIRTS